MHRSTPSPRTPASRRFLLPRRSRWLASTAALVIAGATLLVAPGPAMATTTTPPDQWTGTYGTAGSTSANLGEHVLTASVAGKARTAFTARARQHGPYPPVVLGGVVYSVGGGNGGTDAPIFTAASARTGAVLWTRTLPYALSSYGYGMTGTGSTVLVSFRTDPAGGVLAMNTAKRTIAWRAFLPPTKISWIDRSYPGQPTTDGTRVFISGSSNTVNTYSLWTGAFLWAHPYTTNAGGGLNGVDGVAAGSGYLYTSGGQGLVAYNAATGRKVWGSYPAISYGVPALAGGRVFVNAGNRIESFRAAGCGNTTCRPTWSTPIPSYDPTYIEVAGADASGVFLSYRTQRPGGGSRCHAPWQGNLARLSASTGKLQWQAFVGDYTQGLVRGANVIWAVNELINASCTGDSYRIVGYSTTATTATPIASIPLPSAYYGFPQTLAVASGTLFETANQNVVIGYRVPRT